MNDLDFMVGLMKQGCNVEPCSLSFIPNTRLLECVVAGQYAIQHDTHGRKVGYILHGATKPGKVLHITQAIIDIDRRNLGFGTLALDTVIDRAKQANCRGITLRCAEDLESNQFWQDSGFLMTDIQHPQNKRQRAINVYMIDFWQGLFDWRDLSIRTK